MKESRMASSVIGAAVVVTAVVLLAAATAGSAGGDATQSATRTTLERKGGIGPINSFRIRGTLQQDNYVVSREANGRFVVRSRVRSLLPINPPDGCRVDSEMKVSCRDGVIKGVLARLKDSRDSLVVRPRVRVPTLIYGGRNADKLVGGSGEDELRGKAGPDRILGGRGDDLLRGGPGRDYLSGGPDKDRIIGGPGRDIIRRR
jgi:Ca2+-binding RTX toxin-like protein